MPLLPIKVQCGCGQRYSFEVEPYNGRMPSSIACPVCGADGTASANELIARALSASGPAPAPVRVAPTLAAAPAPTLAAAPVPPPAPATVGVRLQASAHAPAAAPVSPLASEASPAETPGQRLSRELRQRVGGGEDEDKWKWWYYVLAGICIGGYSIWQAYDQHRIKPLGELFLAFFAICIGIWDFQRKRKQRG